MGVGMLTTYGTDRRYWAPVAEAVQRNHERDEYLRAMRNDTTLRSAEPVEGPGRTFKRTIKCIKAGKNPCKRSLTITHKSEAIKAGFVYFREHWWCREHARHQKWYGGKDAVR